MLSTEDIICCHILICVAISWIYVYLLKIANVTIYRQLHCITIYLYSYLLRIAYCCLMKIALSTETEILKFTRWSMVINSQISIHLFFLSVCLSWKLSCLSRCLSVNSFCMYFYFYLSHWLFISSPSLCLCKFNAYNTLLLSQNFFFSLTVSQYQNNKWNSQLKTTTTTTSFFIVASHCATHFLKITSNIIFCNFLIRKQYKL